jgi:hypothetical protein
LKLPDQWVGADPVQTIALGHSRLRISSTLVSTAPISFISEE